MATYTRKSIIENLDDSSLYRAINNSIVSQMNTDSLAEFIRQYFAGTQLISNLSNEIVNRGFLDELFDLYDEDSLLHYDSGYAQDVLDYFCDYETDAGLRASFLQLLWSEQRDSLIEMFGKGCLDVNIVIANVLNYDISSDELLNALATLDYGRFDQLFQMSGGAPPPPILSVPDMIIQIRSNPDMNVSNNINSLFGHEELETIIKGMTASIIDSVFLNLDVCELTDDIASCAYDLTWYDFVLEQVDESLVKEIIYGISEPSFLSGLLLDKDSKSLNKVATVEKDLISDVLRQEENLDVLTYLMYIYKRFGKEVFNQVVEDLNGEITIRKTLTLDELHIYGSSRHGVRKPKQLVVSKAYELQEIGESGELSGIGYAQDSTLPVYSTRYFNRKLTLKQYELSNHLGNVLATILDRKTPQIDSLGGDTLLYYSADVSTAQYYYAYGSAIPELSYQYVDAGDTSSYRFGFNEKEHDVETNLQDYGYRVYNNRIGKFLSIDPLTDEYPFYSPYHFAGNTPIYAIDLDGLEPIPPKVMYDPIGAFRDYDLIGAFWGMVWGSTPEERKKSMDYINSTVDVGPDPNGSTYENWQLNLWAGISIVSNASRDASNMYSYQAFKYPTRNNGNTKQKNTNSGSTSNSSAKTRFSSSTTSKPLLKYVSTSSNSVNSSTFYSIGVKNAWALDKKGMYTQRGRDLQNLNSKYKYQPAGYRDLDAYHKINNFKTFDFYHLKSQHAVSFKSWAGNTWTRSIWTSYIDNIAATIGTTFNGYFIQSASLDVVVKNEAAKFKLESELLDYANKSNVQLNITVQN